MFAGHETDPAAAQHTFTEARKQGEQALARLHARLSQAEGSGKEQAPAADAPTAPAHEPDAIQCVHLRWCCC